MNQFPRGETGRLAPALVPRLGENTQRHLDISRILLLQDSLNPAPKLLNQGSRENRRLI